MYSLIKFLSLFTLLLFSISGFADQKLVQPSTVLKYFDGTITAKVVWISTPSTSKTSQLKIELLDVTNQAYDVDPSLVSVGLFMPEMPDMEIELQNVVSMSDASGSPIPGILIAIDVQFSMQGNWEVQLTLPNPKDQNLTEMKKFNQVVK